MRPIKILIQNALRVEDIIPNSESYLAHIPPPNTSIEVESLSKHLKLVFDNFVRNTEENNLDNIIDKLIVKIIENESFIESDFCKEYLKQLFVDIIVFHDFGKVNENFQVDRMKNSFFKNVKTILYPSYGHSELGTYIYLVHHLERINLFSGLNDDEKVFLSLMAFLFANSINLHHSPQLKEPITRLKKSVFITQFDKLQKYIDLYKITHSGLTTGYFENLKEVVESIEIKAQQIFPLYALTRLNFSLLTASDYLATSEYMNQKPLESLGLIDEELRNKIIFAAENSHNYNKKAYQLAVSDFVTHNPEERTAENLNIIRQNMAVEVIRSIQTNAYKRLFYLEAPTGGGKTNLSMLITAELLKANQEINKVFYVFPFTTLITQTHKAIIQTLNLSENEVSLLHSKAGFQTTEEDDDYGDKKKDYLNNLFVHYPVCLLTHIRFFDILKTNEKETNYLLHRLANSIVILDELQSYPPHHWDKMLYFIQNYAESFNIKFVLMSATLPRIDRLNLPITNKPEFTDLLPNAKKYFRNANFADRVNFKFDYRDSTLEIDKLAEIVLEKSEEYLTKNNKKGVFTIIEFIFKKSATEFEEAINGRFFDEGCIFVLSGTILESRRREIINFLKNEKNRDKKVLLITTQVVEAGVDIDMDLGFKNVSLIDSDEQLAGRVNRNVKKEPCDVYLFQMNKAGIIYKNDKRYIVTRDSISKEVHEEILKKKDFDKLYELVLKQIDRVNGFNEMQNFGNTYLQFIKELEYKNVHEKFQLIESRNLSIFVPLRLPVEVPDEKDSFEKIFSENELKFLKQNHVEVENGEIDGEKVWNLYLFLIKNKNDDYIKQSIEKKVISGIISKFTFSVFLTDKIKQDLVFFSNDEKQFDDYFYLEHHANAKIYDYKKGLVESKIESSENYIL